MHTRAGSYAAFAVLCLTSLAGAASAQTHTCTPCANAQQYCGVIDDTSGEWTSGAYQACTVVPTPPAPPEPPTAVAQGCSPCENYESFCGTYQIQTQVWLSGQWLVCTGGWAQPWGPRAPRWWW